MPTFLGLYFLIAFKTHQNLIFGAKQVWYQGVP